MIKFELAKRLTAANGTLNLSVALEIPKGQRLGLYGESGVGKTSLLRMISGLMQPDKGLVILDGKTVTNTQKKIFMPPKHRNIGYVFQDYALFPNMTVEGNLKYASRDNQAVQSLLELFDLGDLSNRKPATLSGGQKQRVALARALVSKPDLLLLDEPLSALDYQMRRNLQNYLLNAQKEFGFTMILVTHDHAELLRLAERMVWLDKGQVIQDGTPSEILAGDSISGKFRITGEILRIHNDEIIDIIEVLAGDQLIQVVVDRSHAAQFRVGDKVLVISKAFNPIVQPLTPR